MQSASSRIWTRVAVSISHDDNHDTNILKEYNMLICVSYLMTIKIDTH